MTTAAAHFVLLATDREREQAEAILAAEPQIDRDPWARLVLGRDWRGDVNEPNGPRGWSAVLYACHSVFRPRMLVRELLELGADPNRRFATDWGETTALYGAAGVLHDPELTRLLLLAGADPNDGESLYHSVEADDAECLRLLLEHGADPNDRPYIAAAVHRGRGAELVRLLAEYGADPDRAGDERYGNTPLRTPYQHAVLRGDDHVAQTLAALGASTDLGAVDAAVAAFARGRLPASKLPGDLDADQQEALVRAAMRGRLEEVLERVGPGFRAALDGSPEGTLVHHAAWYGKADAARRLLARGADPHDRTRADYETPAAWAALGSR